MDRDMRFQMRIDSAFLSAIDNWRGSQRPIPPRAEAIRQLVEKGIQSEAVCAAEGTEGRQ